MLLLLGIVLFAFFQEATTSAVTSVVAQEGIVRKTQFPRLVIPTTVVLTAFFNLCLNLVVVFAFILAYGVDPMWTWLLFPVALLALFVLTTATSMLLSVLYVRFRDVAIIWTVVAQVLFYATPVLYPITFLKNETYERLLFINPLAADLRAGPGLGVRTRRPDRRPRWSAARSTCCPRSRSSSASAYWASGSSTATRRASRRSSRVVAVPTSLPYPSGKLLGRIGPMGEEDPGGIYEASGRMHRQMLDDTLGPDWTWEGKRVLDFGCGVGRVLRHFLPETERAEFYGCDLDTPSVEWLQQNFSPPYTIFESGEKAGLPQEDGFFDLIYAFSVYTHFTDNWAEWLLEHHRVLADGGILFATFLGEGMLEEMTGEKWDEDRIGMNYLLPGFPWDKGGPLAFNSPWWIRAHWGRAFEIVQLLPRTEPDVASHGIVVARKKPVQVGAEDLLALEPDEPREIAALRHHVDQLAEECVDLRVSHTGRHRPLQRRPRGGADIALLAPHVSAAPREGPPPRRLSGGRRPAPRATSP